MTIELVLIIGIAMWGTVEVIKHTVPSYYDRTQKEVTSYAHDRIDALEKKIAEIVGDAK
jgi:hypothetical protein